MNRRNRHPFWLTVSLVFALAAAPVLPGFAAGVGAVGADVAQAHHTDESVTISAHHAADADEACAQHATCAAKCCGHCITAVVAVPCDDARAVRTVRSPTVPAAPPGAPVAGPLRPPPISRA